MIESIVSLLTGILAELKALRETYTSALNEGRAMRQETISTANAVQAAIQAVTKTEPLQTAAAPKEQAPAPEPFPQPTPVTRDVCGQALVQLATDKNRDAAVAVLAKFNAKLVKEVKEADLLPFYAAIQEALK